MRPSRVSHAAIGIARADENLMELAFESLTRHYPDDKTLLGVIRDIDRVVVFMKAATSKNRTDPIVWHQLKMRDIHMRRPSRCTRS
ncbi:MAG: hypothetical protein ACUVQI_11400 [Thermochromatium sp.]